MESILIEREGYHLKKASIPTSHASLCGWLPLSSIHHLFVVVQLGW